MFVVMERMVGIWFYITTAILSLLAFYFIYKRRIVKFGLICFFVGVLINFFWEFSLFSLGWRTYSEAWFFQMIYQSLTEVGPPFLIVLFILEKMKIISLDRFEDKI